MATVKTAFGLRGTIEGISCDLADSNWGVFISLKLERVNFKGKLRGIVNIRWERLLQTIYILNHR